MNQRRAIRIGVIADTHDLFDPADDILQASITFSTLRTSVIDL